MTKLLKPKIFDGGPISLRTNQILQFVESSINNRKTEQIRQENEDVIIAELICECETSVPIIDFDDVSRLDPAEIRVPSKEFPPEIKPARGEYHTIWCHYFSIPYSDPMDLLRFRPNNIMECDPPDVTGFKNEIEFDIHVFYNTPEELNSKFNEIIEKLKYYFESLVLNLKEFNVSLPHKIKDLYEARKLVLNTQASLVRSMNVPLKQKTVVSLAFSIPAPKMREKINLKSSNHIKQIIEPVLSDSNYFNICKIINDVGKNFERMPSIYIGKSEPDLRDFILFVIDPNFEIGSASGETFNKGGKTDILLRYDSSVVFVAECKFWAGMKEHFKTIDQLIGYLTWRDTKTAIVLFVAQKKIANVLSTIRDETKVHPNFVSALENTAENWFNFVFHLPGDTGRKFALATLVFHLPEFAIINEQSSV